MVIENGSSEANFFNNISNADYDLLSNSDYDIFLEIIKQTIEQGDHFDDMQILEVCCGTGIFGRKILVHLKSKQITITGVDISKKPIDYLRSLKVENYLPVHGNVIDKILFEDKTFDIILCPFALHHLLRSELELFLKNAFKWLKPHGYVIAIEPNGSNPVLYMSNRIGKVYRSIFRNTRYVSPNETVYSCRSYHKSFLNSNFMKMTVIKVQLEGKLPPKMGLGMKVFVGLKNHLSKLFGYSVAYLIYKKEAVRPSTKES